MQSEQIHLTISTSPLLRYFITTLIRTLTSPIVLSSLKTDIKNDSVKINRVINFLTFLLGDIEIESCAIIFIFFFFHFSLPRVINFLPLLHLGTLVNRENAHKYNNKSHFKVGGKVRIFYIICKLMQFF